MANAVLQQCGLLLNHLNNNPQSAEFINPSALKRLKDAQQSLSLALKNNDNELLALIKKTDETVIDIGAQLKELIEGSLPKI